MGRSFSNTFPPIKFVWNGQPRLLSFFHRAFKALEYNVFAPNVAVVLFVVVFVYFFSVNGPVVIPESFLKKRKTLEAIKAKRDARDLKQKKALKSSRREAFKRAEKYVKEYRQTEQDAIRFKRQAKNNGNFYIEPEAKVVFVIRLRG